MRGGMQYLLSPKKPEDIVNAITYLYENRNVLIAYQNNSYEYYHKKTYMVKAL